jgi:hypothetical protein
VLLLLLLPHPANAIATIAAAAIARLPVLVMSLLRPRLTTVEILLNACRAAYGADVKFPSPCVVPTSNALWSNNGSAR